MGDVSSQNAPVVRRQLPANSDVIGRNYGNGDVRRGSDSADESVKPGHRKSAVDIISKLSGDAKAAGSKSGARADIILSNVSHASHLLTAYTFCLPFTAQYCWHL